jgi:hypothetical protein
LNTIGNIQDYVFQGSSYDASELGYFYHIGLRVFFPKFFSTRKITTLIFLICRKSLKMKSVCLALLVACVLISAVHGQWYRSYGRGGWGDDYYGGYGLGGGLIGDGLIGGGRFDRWGGGLGGGHFGIGRGRFGRRGY